MDCFNICAGFILLADQLLILISLKMIMVSSKNVRWIIPSGYKARLGQLNN